MEEGSQSDYADMCYSTKELQKINPKYPMRSEDVVGAAYRNMLCVQTDNSGTKGSFYESGTTLATLYPKANSVFDVNGHGSKKYDFNSYLNNDPTSSSNADAIFDKRERIPVAYESGTGGIVAYGGGLPLPSGTEEIYCNDFNYVRFGVNVDAGDNSCVRQIADLANECTSLLDVGRFTTDLFVGKKENTKPGSSVLPSADLDAYVRVNQTEIWDATGKHNYNSTVPWDITTPYTTSYDVGTTTCKNALVGLIYVVEFDSMSTIKKVETKMKVQDVVLGATTLTQSFGVEFVFDKSDVTTIAKSLELNNLIERPRSGNPGYIMGKPVLGGTTHPDSELAVRALRDGLSLGSTSDGTCDSNVLFSEIVNFGEDVTHSCTVEFTKAELKDFCTLTTSPYLSTVAVDDTTNIYVPEWLVPVYGDDDAYIGIFGNADPLDITQWLKISKPSFAVPTRSFSGTDSRCAGTPTSVHYKFMWTNVGNVNNPQAKIIAAQVDLDSAGDNLVFSKDIGGTGSASMKQKFQFDTTVTWVYYEKDSAIYSPPTPPIIFSVPYDVFYPFEIQSAAQPAAGGQGVWLRAGIVGLVSLVVMVAGMGSNI